MILFLKFVCLVLAVVYGFGAVARVIHKVSIDANVVVLMGIGVAGFITLQWLM